MTYGRRMITARLRLRVKHDTQKVTATPCSLARGGLGSLRAAVTGAGRRVG